MREFVERTAAILGLSHDALHFGALTSRPEEMSHDSANISRLVALCEWAPCTSNEDGVRLTLDAD